MSRLTARHYAALLLAAFLGTVPARARADDGTVINHTMPPFLIGKWRMGPLIPFAPGQPVFTPDEMERMTAEKTLTITTRAIAWQPRFRPHRGTQTVTAEAQTQTLRSLALLDPARTAGTPLANPEQPVAVVNVTPADCPASTASEIDDRQGHQVCNPEVFFSPDGFKQLTYVWFPGAVALLTKQPAR